MGLFIACRIDAVFVRLFPHSCQAVRAFTLFFYYGLDKEDPNDGKGNGERRGGKTFWGTLALIQKTFGLSHNQVMWEESWINLVLKMNDMPYYNYSGTCKENDAESKEGTLDILNQKFSKFIER